MKYVDTKVVFREVPDEVSLAINISGCPVRCPGCHSSYLAQDIGTVLDENSLDALVRENPGISCVSFQGGDADPAYIARLSGHIHETYPGMKTCWYSGRGLDMAQEVLPELDYIKVGPYIDERGPLDSKSTNQRFYSVRQTPAGPDLEDITYRFQQKIF